MTTLELRDCVTRAVEAIALNDEQARVLFDPSPAIDSLAERIVALRHRGVPEPVIRDLLMDVRRLLHLNQSERGEECTIAGRLDALVARPPGENLTFKTIAQRLRGDLLDLAHCDAARARVTELIARVHADRLLSPTLRHELGGRRHDVLRALLHDTDRNGATS